MMLLEYFDYSLALISIQFCIPPEDLIYIAVNQRKEHSDKAHLSPETLVRLKKLNWPDFLFYQALNSTFWKKIEFYGEENVKLVAEDIVAKSQKLSAECIDFDNNGNNQMVDRVLLLPDQVLNSTCMKMQFQGVKATKIFMAKDQKN